mgnify:CR=1 FL=1
MIYIFGDSYGDKKKHWVHNKGRSYKFASKGPFWYDYLEEYDKVHNFSKSGTSPYYSFDKFYYCYENKLMKRNDKIVFILSSPHRIGNNNLGDLILSRQYQGDYEEQKWFEGNTQDILTTYNYLRREIDFINFKNVSFLKFFSQLNESKIIVFKAFDNESFDIDTEKYPEHLYDLSILNDENFYYYPNILFNITVNEVIKNDISIKKTDDWGEVNNSMVDVGRTNHLTDYNHKIFSNIILNFFYNTNFDETFKENFYKKQNINSSEFIYE